MISEREMRVCSGTSRWVVTVVWEVFDEVVIPGHFYHMGAHSVVFSTSLSARCARPRLLSSTQVYATVELLYQQTPAGR
jgi:hypothetical protein